MDLLKLFSRLTIDNSRQQNDLVECDNICQLLVILSKLIADLRSDEKLVSILNNDEDEELIKLEVNIENLTFIIPKVFEIIEMFDFRDVKFSGYRSFFSIVKKCINNLNLCLSKTLHHKSKRHQSDSEWFMYSQCLFQLTNVAKCLLQMMWSRKESRSLFLNKCDDELIYLKIMDNYDSFLPDPFYGQCLGFYLCESCQLMAKFLCSLQLGLGHAMAVPKSDFELFIYTVINGTQNLFLEDKRGSQMCGLFKQATVTFCKQFWNLVDHPFLVRWSHLVLPYLKVIKQITLQPIGLHMPLNDGSDTVIKISPPVAHNGFAEVSIRLLSNKFREGMEWGLDVSKEVTIDPPSKCILIHCHGGGFVAQSSQSHDGYLRQWAIDLNCPIVSIDYSHAPENPFPRAHEECFYTYCWVLRNLRQFGCDSDCRVVICGDSAGGNLALGCVIRAIQLNIRLPDGVFLAYPAALVDFIPSPARMLGVIDPILPIGVLARCLLAYIGVNEDELVQTMNKEATADLEEAIEEAVEDDGSLKVEKVSFLEHNSFDCNGVRLFYSREDAVSPLHLLENTQIIGDPVMSPILAGDDIFRRCPPMSIVASEFDPLLDDSVELCKRMDKAGAPFLRLQVMPDLPHGFLNMSSPVTRECAQANRVCVAEIRRLLSGNFE